MRIDLYTKTILTVIAACMVYLCFGRPPAVPAVQAQTQPTRVVIAGWEPGPLRVFLAGWDGRFGGGDALPVVIKER
jgi:hypothetical protein